MTEVLVIFLSGEEAPLKDYFTGGLAEVKAVAFKL